MLEGSGQHMLNFNELKKRRTSKDLVNFSPVLEKIEEYESMEEKGQNKQSDIKEDGTNNKEILKDSVISSILHGLDDKNIPNKSVIVKKKKFIP